MYLLHQYIFDLNLCLMLLFDKDRHLNVEIRQEDTFWKIRFAEKIRIAKEDTLYWCTHLGKLHVTKQQTLCRKPRLYPRRYGCSGL